MADLDKPDPEIDAIWREVIMVRQGSHELVEWITTNGLFQNCHTLEG